MQKKISMIARLLALLLLLVTGLHQPGAAVRAQQVDATHPDLEISTPYNISNSPPPDYENTQRVRAAIAPDAFLHAAWMEGADGHDDGPAYVKGQATVWPQWEWAGHDPHNNPGYVNPAIALDSQGTVHLAWASLEGGRNDIWYAFKSVGQDWSWRENISNEGYNTVYPAIAVDRQNGVWVTWQASVTEQDTEVYARSKPAGGGWGNVMAVSNNANTDDQSPDVAVDSNGTPYVVWRRRPIGGGAFDIFYSKYVGGSWTAPQNISASTKSSTFPRVSTDDSGNVYVVWDQEVNEFSFYIQYRRWDGSQWMAAKPVTSPNLKALRPVISADATGILYVVWQDYRHGTGSPPETYFGYSTDAGETWLGDENVSNNGTGSYWPDVVAQAGGYGHIFWQDGPGGDLDIYYSKADLEIGPTEPPHGWVNILAHDPLNNETYTRLLDVTLQFSATAAPGATVTHLRVCNAGACDPLPNWETFVTSKPNWQLRDTGAACDIKSVHTWFRDDATLESITYTDYILFDNYLAANMLLNEGNPYTNRTMVMVNSDNEPGGCSGMKEMRLREDGYTYTNPMSFYTRLYYFLAPSGPTMRTVHVEYSDRAENIGTASDSILLDTVAPTGTAPIVPSSTTNPQITVSGLQGFDDTSGVANVWFANRQEGPWGAMVYCASPPCSYDWNLGYGGPPIQLPDLHTVYVKYEDASGYGAFPGNFSEVYTGTISVSGISSIYVPLLFKDHEQLTIVPGTVESEEVDLILLSDPQEASPGQNVLLYLAARREQHEPLEGTLRMVLPEGLRVVYAWSAYGQLLQVSDRLVVSHELAWSQQAAWIMVEAQVEGGDGLPLRVQGNMTWDQGSVTVLPGRIENR